MFSNLTDAALRHAPQNFHALKSKPELLHISIFFLPYIWKNKTTNFIKNVVSEAFH